MFIVAPSRRESPQRDTKKHKILWLSVPLVVRPQLHAHVIDGIAPFAVAIGAGGAHLNRVRSTDRKAVDRHRTRVGQAGDHLRDARGAAGSNRRMAHLIGLCITEGLRLREQLAGFALRVNWIQLINRRKTHATI